MKKEKTNSGCFTKGRIPFNKGMKQTEWLNDEQINKLKETYIHKQKTKAYGLIQEEGRFLPHNTKAKGTITLRTHVHRVGRNRGKVETEYFINIDWKGNRKPNNLYKRYVWEVAHQQDVPKGYVVYIKNQKKDDIRTDNLELITRKELLKRNSVGKWEKEKL
jgi:hypothetical protein